ncbi:MAG: Ig-like domain-containing protein [archaeon]
MMVRGKQALIILISIAILLALSGSALAELDDGCCCFDAALGGDFTTRAECVDGTFIGFADLDEWDAIVRNYGDEYTYCNNYFCADTPPTPVCGNGIIEEPEECDGTNLGGASCGAFPEFTGGTIACDVDCQLDTSACVDACTTDSQCDDGDDCTIDNCEANGDCSNIFDSSIPDCECEPGQCNFTTDSWCNAAGRWLDYNLGNYPQALEYCQKCEGDPDCLLIDICIPTDPLSNGICPPHCPDATPDQEDIFDPDCSCLTAAENTGPNGNEYHYDVMGVCPDWCVRQNGAPNDDQDCEPEEVVETSCGDGVIDEPWEECESDDDCTNGMCIAPGQNGACNCFFFPDTCQESGFSECFPGNTCENGADCTDECKCPDTCDPASVALVNVTPVDDMKAFDLEWVLIPEVECDEGYRVYRCEDDGAADCDSTGGDFSFIQGTEALVYRDDNPLLKTSTRYCYYVVGEFPTGEMESNIVCQDMGDDECINMEFEEVCINNSGYACNALNQLVMIKPPEFGDDKDCKNHDPKEICLRKFDGSGEPMQEVQCNVQAPCDKCNGVFAMYGAILGNVVLEYADDLHLCETVPTCVYDYTQTTVDKYHKCENITSCYAYNSKGVCEEDPCSLNKDCDWTYINQELGKGVCYSDNPEYEDCSECEWEWCSEEICQYFGNCYFDDEGYDPKGCIAQSQTFCKQFDTEEDCINYNGLGQDFDADVEYAAGGIRSGGSHEIQNESYSFFGYTKCKWDEDKPIGDKCYRDADDNSPNLLADLRDCETYPDATCELDFESPQTEIVNPPGKTFSKFPEIEYSVLDGIYNVNSLETYFCFSESTCYPNSTLANKATYSKIHPMIDSEMNTVKTYRLFYYSLDPARNLEPIKDYTFTVDAEPFVVTVPYNVFNQMEIDGTQIWISDLTITISASREAVCSASLSEDSGGAVQVWNDIDRLRGTSWTRTYVALEDGYYNYAVYCEDIYGNIFDEVIQIPIAGDFRIDDPQPTGTVACGNVEISIDTYADATCSYGNGAPTTPFTVTGGMSHSSTLSLIESEVWGFNTACTFADSGEYVEGNEADQIRFATDCTPPYSDYYGWDMGGEFESGGRYRFARVRFNCTDWPLIDYGRDWSSGCQKLYFSVQDNCESQNLDTFVEVENPPLLTRVFDESGEYKICFFSEDAVGNRETVQTVTLSIDATPPNMTLDVTPFGGGPSVTVLGFGVYSISIEATEPSTDLDLHFVNRQYDFNVTQESPTSWTAILKIDLENFGGEYLETSLEAIGYDEAGNQGRGSIDIIIDTVTPPEPVFEPDFLEYPDYDYPLFPNDEQEVFYTSDGNLFVSGHTSNSRELIWFYYNNLIVHEYDQLVFNAEIDHEALQTVYETALANATLVKLPTIALPSNWPAGYYVHFEGKERESYGNYKKYYKIMNSERVGGILHLTISPALEEEIPVGTTAKSYRKEVPYTWFGMLLDLPEGLTNISAGYRNYMQYHAYTPTYKVFYDSEAPIIRSMNPIDETVTTSTINITFTILDEGLDAERVEVAVGDENVTYSLFVNYSVEDTYPKKTYRFFVNPNQDLDNAIYNVTVFARDFAGNNKSAEWQFEVREGALESPDFRWRNGFIQPSPMGVYYINSLDPGFALVYAISELAWTNITLLDENNTINCNDITFDQLDQEIQDDLTEPFQSSALNCSFTETLEEEPYRLKAEAAGLIDEHETFPGYKVFNIEIDTHAPLFTLDMPDRIRPGVALPIDLTVTNEKEIVVVMNISGDELTMDTTAQGTEFTFTIPETFDWGVPADHEEEKDITIRVSDYAGNHEEEQYNILVDNRPPYFSITDIYPQCVGENLTGQCITNKLNVRFVGESEADTEIIIAYVNNIRKGEILECGGPTVEDCIGDGTFSMNITFDAQPGQEVFSNVTLVAQDYAGNEIGATISILHDWLAPGQPHITIS